MSRTCSLIGAVAEGVPSTGGRSLARPNMYLLQYVQLMHAPFFFTTAFSWPRKPCGHYPKHRKRWTCIHKSIHPYESYVSNTVIAERC